jgi:hypothetical protein
LNRKFQIVIVFIAISLIVLGSAFYFMPTSEPNISPELEIKEFQFILQENWTDGSVGEPYNIPSSSGKTIHEEFEIKRPNNHIIQFILAAQYAGNTIRPRGTPEMTVTPPPDLTEYEFEEIEEYLIGGVFIYHTFTMELDISVDMNITITANSTEEASSKFNDSYADYSTVGTWNVDIDLPGYFYYIYLIFIFTDFLEIEEIVELSGE